MNREIKFSYIAQHEDTGMFMEQVFTMAEIEGGDFVNQWKKKFPRWNIITRREWTGLKDKNGKEIYEGDIVRLFGTEKPCSVVFQDGMFVVKAPYHKEEWFDLNMFEHDERVITLYGVIGNIYENPELLG